MTKRNRDGRLQCLSVGAITRDRYGDTVEIGGSAYYASRVFSGLGASARIATNAPSELSGIPELNGIELLFTGNAPVPVFVNEYSEASARRQWVENAAAKISPRALSAPLLDVDALFLCPVLGEVPIEPWISAVRARCVGLGIQGFLRAAETSKPGVSKRSVVPAPFFPDPALLAEVDAAFLSEEDLALAPSGFLDLLRTSVRLVFLTRGAEGARIFRDGGVAEIGVHPTNAIDPTGAGDAFAAACLFAFASDEDPIAAARLGAAAASIVVEGVAGACLHRIGEAHERVRSIQRLRQ
jgi:hypothetical protein